MSAVPEAVHRLVEKFRENQEHYRSGAYREAQCRLDFIDPLFEALGWDMANRQGWADAYRDVQIERSVEVEEARKRPDYTFRIGATEKFFVEAKKPEKNIKEDSEPAYQLRRYAWSKGLPLSILTDFEEFAIYDCRLKPSQKDKASAARIFYCTFEEYEQKWGEISSIFARESILKGSFDRYAEATKGKRGTSRVDDAILEEIEGWRDLLARNLILRNENLSKRDLNFAVQKIIDRIIFLRICEDRNIEPYGQLNARAAGQGVYKNLLNLFHQADEKYNSGLFHFSAKDPDCVEDPDVLTPTLILDDKVLKNLIRSLYYPASPYEFSVIPAEILGHVYERFLGRTINLSESGRRVHIEDKPEVRKAGGVYYTPTFIVDYIVRQTIRDLLYGMHPQSAAKIKVVDPACGSGSFLIGAYQYLLDWHQSWYAANEPEKHARGKRPAVYLNGKNLWRLTSAKRREILLNNIFGVDIDPQAVEVTKLSLLLKVLEGEKEELLREQLRLFHERALPDLSKNIKCGNSLIGPDFYEDRQMTLLPLEEKLRINVFDWKREFREIFKQGGFDAVIGNPPYVFGRDWKSLGIGQEQKGYFTKRYKSSPYQLDMFSLFMEKASQLSAVGGWVGLIVPNVWLTNTYSGPTRAFHLASCEEITLAVPPSNVFPGITVDTLVFTGRKSPNPGDEIAIELLDELGRAKRTSSIPTQEYIDGDRPISVSSTTGCRILVERLMKSCQNLGTLASVTRGVHPYRIGGYGKSAFGSGAQTIRDVAERPYHSSKRRSGYRPFIYGKDLHRYHIPVASEYIRYGPWLAEPRDSRFFAGERIYSRKILADRLVVTIADDDSVADQQVYITKVNDQKLSHLYLLGILGSHLTAFVIRAYFDEATDAFPQIKVSQLRQLPVPTRSGRKALKTAEHDHMVSLVEQMLDLHQRKSAARNPHETEALDRQIHATDEQIDRLVYELYGLTEEEIRLVEEGG